VLNCNDVSGNLNELEIPCLLIEPEIEWAATFYAGGTGQDIPKAFHFFQTHLYPIMAPLAEETLHEVADIHVLIKKAQHTQVESHASILRVLQDFASSRSYIRLGRMAVLSHFSLIEAIITHEPKTTAGDSLNHQVSTKMPLLFRRFSQPLDVTNFFKTDDLKKAWKLLYDVRSRFAHGDSADFKKGPLVALGNFQQVERFTYLSLKRLLKLALQEPELIHDLKAC
jgi:hypothetical protein